MSAIRRSTRLSTNARPSNQAWRIVDNDNCDSDNDIENQNMNSARTNRRSSVKVKLKKIPTNIDEAKTPTLRKRETKRSSRVIYSETSSSCNSSDEKDKQFVSPPKQGKFVKNPVSLFSPTRLLDKLSIVADNNDEHQPKEEKKPEKSYSRYQNAKRVLNNVEANCLPCRENELKELHDFLKQHLDEEKSGSLYVSGQPGTGKTACLSKLIKSDDFATKFVHISINCTSISTGKTIYKKICEELKLKVNGRTEKDHLAAIENHLSSRHKMILMILDEVDQLQGQKQSILFTIFQWPAKMNSKLLLIGIANSLDLTDRMLKRLNAKCTLIPKLMHFQSYTKQQIVEIFKSRLEEANVMSIFPPVTIQLLSAKVAAVSGDIRRALDIGRRVVEIAENHQRNGDKLDLNEFGIATETEEKKIDEFKPVHVTQVIQVMNNVYGASQTLNDDMDDTFPIQQKFMLCSLMLMLRKEKNKDITFGRLHDVYKRVCTKRNVLSVDQAEFLAICSLVESKGIIRMANKKESRQSKVLLQWDEEEVNSALQDKQLIASILDDISCLGR